MFTGSENDYMQQTVDERGTLNDKMGQVQSSIMMLAIDHSN